MKEKIFWVFCLIVFVFSLIYINNYLDSKQNISSNLIAIEGENITEYNQTNSVFLSNISNENIIQGTTENFNTVTANGIVFIDFYADWCSPCKALSPIIDEVANEGKYENVTFMRINIDEEPFLANKYNVISIPTLVLLKDGQELKRNVGYISKQDLEEFLYE